MTANMEPSEDQEVGKLLNSFEYRFSRRFMIILRKLARVTLVDNAFVLRVHSEPQSNLEPRQKRCLYKSQEEEDYYEAAVRFGPLSNIIFSLFLLSSIHLNIVLYHQYKLDWNRTRYDYLIFRRSLGTDDPRCYHRCTHRPVPEELLKKLNETIQYEHRVLDFLGQPLQDLTYLGAGIYCTQYLGCLIAFLMPLINFNFLNSYDNDIFRILVDYKRELKLCQQLVSEQVNEFLFSHRNSARTIIVQRGLGDHHDMPQRQEIIENVETILAAQERDRFIERELLAMQARNELLPANRRVEWVRSWLRWHLLATVIGILLGLATSQVLTLIACLLPHFNLLASGQPSFWPTYYLNDWLVIFDSALIMGLMCVSIGLYASTLTFSSLDQLWIVDDLRLQHELFLSKSQNLLDLPSRRRKSNLSDGTQRDHLNCDLLALLIKFRIFVRQLASERKSGGFAVTCVLLSFFLLPVVSRLHAPYLDPSLTGINWFLAIASVFVLIPVSIGLLPPCEMFNHCVRTHRAQVKLLAHLIEVEQLMPNFYNGHLVSRLRREVSTGFRLEEEFAISFAGSHLTYSLVIRFYFWFGALMLAALLRPGTVMVTSGLATSTRTLDPLDVDYGADRPWPARRSFPIVVDSILDDPLGIMSY